MIIKQHQRLPTQTTKAATHKYYVCAAQQVTSATPHATYVAKITRGAALQVTMAAPQATCAAQKFFIMFIHTKRKENTVQI